MTSASAVSSSNSSHPTQFLPKWLTARRSSLCNKPINSLPLFLSKTSTGVLKSNSNRRFRPAFELPSPSDPEPETYRNRFRHTKPSAYKFAEMEADLDEEDEDDSNDEHDIEPDAETLTLTNNKNIKNNNITDETESSGDENKVKFGRNVSNPESTYYKIATPSRIAPRTAITLPAGFRRENRRGSMPEILLHRVNNSENSFLIGSDEARNPRTASRFTQLPRSLFFKCVKQIHDLVDIAKKRKSRSNKQLDQMEDNESAPEGPPPPPPPPLDAEDNAEENNEEAEDELCGMHAAPLGSSSKSALTKTVGGKSLLVTRANSSFDEIDGGADNEGAVLAYSTTVVPPEDTALDDEGSKSSVASSSVSKCICKSIPSSNKSNSAADTKPNLSEKNTQVTSATIASEVRMEQQRHTSITSGESASTSTSASAAATAGGSGSSAAGLSVGAQCENEPVQRRVSKSRARFQIESRFESRLEDSCDDPSLSELKTQLDEYRDRIAETDARIRRAMDERELLIEHLLRKMQAQYPGGDKEEGSSVQLVQMCVTLASSAKQLAAAQDTSEWAARKRSLSRLLGSTCSIIQNSNRSSASAALTSSISAGSSGPTDSEADRPLTSTRVSLPQLQKGIEAMKRSLELLAAAQKRQNGDLQPLTQASIAE